MNTYQPSRLILVLIAIISLVVWGVACSKGGDTLPEDNTGLHPMPLIRPSNFPSFVYDTASNPITKEGFELGRKLFYDVKLSRNLTISCGFCHIQTSAFTQHGHAVSHGIDDRLGTRNSQPTFNLAWSKFFFWDGGVFNLDLQPLAPIKNHEEMDEDISNVIAKLKADAYYPKQFKRVFGSDNITATMMLKALSQFMLQCVSANSRYDRFVRGDGVQLTNAELAGKALFEQKCASCHSTDLFTDNSFHNNGLPPGVINDKGRSMITLQAADDYTFKTPTLRNLGYTPPYMHDGRFRTLHDVLDHYSSGVQNSPTLDPLLKQGGVIGIPLTNTEKVQIIAFLNTLNDESFVRDPRFSEQ